MPVIRGDDMSSALELLDLTPQLLRDHAELQAKCQELERELENAAPAGAMSECDQLRQEVEHLRAALNDSEENSKRQEEELKKVPQQVSNARAEGNELLKAAQIENEALKQRQSTAETLLSARTARIEELEAALAKLTAEAEELRQRTVEVPASPQPVSSSVLINASEDLQLECEKLRLDLQHAQSELFKAKSDKLRLERQLKKSK
ncbi:MAG: hypothetical protein R3C18_08400 [Planctomycetaceae bacterium]